MLNTESVHRALLIRSRCLGMCIFLRTQNPKVEEARMNRTSWRKLDLFLVMEDAVRRTKMANSKRVRLRLLRETGNVSKTEHAS